MTVNHAVTTAKTLQKLYGPYAFGVISLLIIWFAVVKPEFSRREDDVRESAKIAETLRATSENIRIIAEANSRIAERLAYITAKLEKQ